MRLIESSCFSPFEKALLPAENLSRYAFSLCGGPCAGLFRIENGEMLEQLVRSCIKAGYPYKVLGGMTNILVSDDGFDGIVLLNRKGTLSHQNFENDTVILSADTGVSMSAVVRYCIEHEISGMEWAAGLPGTVGGAVCGNAGAFGTETSDLFLSGKMLDEIGSVCQIHKEDMDYAYRSSSLKGQNNNRILLKADFLLKKGSGPQIASQGEINREKRRNTQPVTENSLGSVFKNPEGESAGKLIQAAGLKGFSIGKAVVSMKHANFITVTKGVKSEDYHKLVMHIRQTVFEQFGIMLEPEIEMLGFSQQTAGV